MRGHVHLGLIVACACRDAAGAALKGVEQEEEDEEDGETALAAPPPLSVRHMEEALIGFVPSLTNTQRHRCRPECVSGWVGGREGEWFLLT